MAERIGYRKWGNLSADLREILTTIEAATEKLGQALERDDRDRAMEELETLGDAIAELESEVDAW